MNTMALKYTGSSARSMPNHAVAWIYRRPATLSYIGDAEQAVRRAKTVYVFRLRSESFQLLLFLNLAYYAKGEFQES